MNSLLLFLLIVLGRGEGKQQSNTSQKSTSNILSLKKHPQRSLQKTFIRPFCSLTTIFYNSAKNYETEKHLQLFESSFNDAKSLLKHTIIQFDLQAFYQIYHYTKKKKSIFHHTRKSLARISTHLQHQKQKIVCENHFSIEAKSFYQ